MSNQQPQLTRTGNPLEHQITYTNTPPIINELYISNSLDDSDEYIEQSSSDKEDLLLSEELTSKHMALRASTAPARPLTDIEEFRRSSDFLLLEHTVACSSYLIQRQDQKYDLDSEEGQRECKKYLNQLERLCEVFKVTTQSRSYRNEFSKAYRVLYREGSLCYLTEILDSAQEGFPYLWVNGEKYVFSREVLDAGQRLFNCFCKTQHFLRDIYSRVCEESCQDTVEQITEEIAEALEVFDRNWVSFEKFYVVELMLIESDARRFITDAIKQEREMVMLEMKEKAKGRIVLDSAKYNTTRVSLVQLIGKINSVANVEGKGRDDLGADIMVAAEGLSRRFSGAQSKSVTALVEKIRQSFNAIRALLRRYEQNIEIVDPQLKNNQELVDCLTSFETSWEKGKAYFLSSKRCSQFLFFSQLIEEFAEKYDCLREQIDCRDAELFFSLPGILILKCLEEEDHGICKHFYPPMFDENEPQGMILRRLKRAFSMGKLAAYSDQEYIQLLESAIIGQPVDADHRTQVVNSQFDNIDIVLHKIKLLSMEMHRHKPSEWNQFIDVSLG